MNEKERIKNYYTYTNSFHSTSYRSTYSPTELEDIINTEPCNRSPAQIQLISRMHKKLCGIAGCTCGDIFGRRA